MHIRPRRGFTAIELMMVLTIVGALAVVVLPRASKVIERSELRAAKQEVATAVRVARAAAIQSGRPARLARTSNLLRVTVQQGAAQVPVGGPIDAYAGHNVFISMTPDTIRFDPRGYAFGINSATGYQVIRLQRGPYFDSVCVSRFGKVTSKGACL